MICLGCKSDIENGNPAIRIKVAEKRYFKLSYVGMIYHGDDLSVYSLPIIGADCISTWVEE